jgi:hypothetical protein
LVKNLSPVAGTIVGGPLGLALAGGLSAAGDLGRGKNIGESLKGGLKNAALAGVGQAAGSALGYHGGLGALTGGGDAATSATTGAAGAAPAPIADAPTAASYAGAPSTGALSSVDMGVGTVAHGGLSLPSVPNLTETLRPAVDPRTFLGKVGDKAGGLLDFAESHPNTASGVFSGLGSIATSGSENRLRNAQANQLEQQGGITQNELAQRKASQAALAPIWSALASAPTTRKPIAANPYAAGA